MTCKDSDVFEEFNRKDCIVDRAQPGKIPEQKRIIDSAFRESSSIYSSEYITSTEDFA
jgi:hypothetical protein